MAKTGSGKTLSFLVPLLHKLLGSEAPRPRHPRALVLAPTRELVQQIKGECDKVDPLSPSPLLHTLFMAHPPVAVALFSAYDPPPHSLRW